MMPHQPQPLHTPDAPVGSLDGVGAGDHDLPYRFGWKPRAVVPYPFNTRQYGRLLVLRGRVRDGAFGAGESRPSSATVAAHRDSRTRGRVVVARFANGQPRTYRLAPPSSRHVAYRRLAVAILGLDVATLAGELSAMRRSVLPRAA